MGDILVIRLLTPLTHEQIQQLNTAFAPLVRSGKIYETPPLPEETDHLTLPRIAFEHTRRDFGLLRALLDEINAFE